MEVGKVDWLGIWLLRGEGGDEGDGGMVMSEQII